MPIPIQCPTCRRQLNVPDELRGRQVKCAECNTIFTANAADDPSAVPTVAAAYEGDGALHVDQDPGMARILVRGPAIALIVVAMLNGLLGAYLITSGVVTLSLDDAAIKQFHDLYKDVLPPELERFQEFKIIFLAIARVVITIGIVWDGFAFLSLIGGVQMLRLRSRGFALFAAILVMVPIISFFFILGIPIGIWSLVVLSKPEVVAAFLARPRS